MRKILISLLVCAVMVGTLAATSAVSAAPAGKSNIWQHDIISYTAGGLVVGKLTVNFATGHYVANANYGKGGIKDQAKAIAGESGIIEAINSAAQPSIIKFGLVTLNNGGTAHGEGTLDQATLDWLITYGGGAAVNLSFP